jgi:hypothetical protein
VERVEARIQPAVRNQPDAPARRHNADATLGRGAQRPAPDDAWSWPLSPCGPQPTPERDLACCPQLTAGTTPPRPGHAAGQRRCSGVGRARGGALLSVLALLGLRRRRVGVSAPHLAAR